MIKFSMLTTSMSSWHQQRKFFKPFITTPAYNTQIDHISMISLFVICCRFFGNIFKCGRNIHWYIRAEWFAHHVLLSPCLKIIERIVRFNTSKNLCIARHTRTRSVARATCNFKKKLWIWKLWNKINKVHDWAVLFLDYCRTTEQRLNNRKLWFTVTRILVTIRNFSWKHFYFLQSFFFPINKEWFWWDYCEK